MERVGAPSFWNNVNESDGCWEWTASVNGKGYGQLTADGKRYMAHRYSYFIHKGPIPKGLFILHKCDNRKCVNPDHLFAGTHIENMKDMMDKDRQAKGTRIGASKLTPDIVRRIRGHRESGMKYKDIAGMFGLSVYHVKDICHRRYWAGVV